MFHFLCLAIFLIKQDALLMFNKANLRSFMMDSCKGLVLTFCFLLLISTEIPFSGGLGNFWGTMGIELLSDSLLYQISVNTS